MANDLTGTSFVDKVMELITGPHNDSLVRAFRCYFNRSLMIFLSARGDWRPPQRMNS